MNDIPVRPDPQSHQRVLYQVRWTRDHWQRDGENQVRWQRRWYASATAAQVLARGLAVDGAIVTIDTWDATWRRRDDLTPGDARMIPPHDAELGDLEAST